MISTHIVVLKGNACMCMRRLMTNAAFHLPYKSDVRAGNDITFKLTVFRCIIIIYKNNYTCFQTFPIFYFFFKRFKFTTTGLISTGVLIRIQCLCPKISLLVLGMCHILSNAIIWPTFLNIVNNIIPWNIVSYHTHP